MTATPATLRDHWTRLARTTLSEATEAVIPSVASTGGLAPVLRALARSTIGPGFHVDDLLAKAWNINRTKHPGRLSQRIREAGFAPAIKFITMYRCAAIGALVKAGASVTEAGTLIDRKDPHQFELLQRAESYYRREPRSAGVLAEMRRQPAEWAFQRYVVPLLPLPTDARWQRPMRPLSADSGARPCKRCKALVVAGPDGIQRDLDGVVHRCPSK